MAHILLYGPPGSGKTTLGRMLADSLQLPFIDLDRAIESQTRMSVTSLVQQRGESGFREMEGSVLREQLDRNNAVIALGGGALLREENRTLAEARGRVVCLKAEASQLGQRLRKDPMVRPLLAGDLDAKLSALLEARAAHYESFGAQLDANRSPEELVGRLQAMIGRFHVSGMGNYDVLVEAGALDRLGEILRERDITAALVVSDRNVSRTYSARTLESLHRSGDDAEMLLIEGGEPGKNLDTVSDLWQGFLKAGLDRKSTVIAVGGGVVSDLAGFAAATFMRGVHWICVPTTLLSMVDASIGGKTGFDLPVGKNLIGAFHAPVLVLSDPQVLATLPEAELRSGLAEMVKHGIVGDPELFEACTRGLSSVREHLAQLTCRAVAVKVRIIQSDPYEKGERAALNFGHTVGHAIELVSDFKIRHGEAVAMGMVAEARLSERLTMARRGVAEEIARALVGLGLPVSIPQGLPRPGLMRAMQADKKKADGVVRFALPVDIGHVQVNVAVDEPESALEEARP